MRMFFQLLLCEPGPTAARLWDCTQFEVWASSWQPRVGGNTGGSVQLAKQCYRSIVASKGYVRCVGSIAAAGSALVFPCQLELVKTWAQETKLAGDQTDLSTALLSLQAPR